jgi:hypothetical protein
VFLAALEIAGLEDLLVGVQRIIVQPPSRRAQAPLLPQRWPRAKGRSGLEEPAEV